MIKQSIEIILGVPAPPGLETINFDWNPIIFYGIPIMIIIFSLIYVWYRNRKSVINFVDSS